MEITALQEGNIGTSMALLVCVRAHVTTLQKVIFYFLNITKNALTYKNNQVSIQLISVIFLKSIVMALAFCFY